MESPGLKRRLPRTVVDEATLGDLDIKIVDVSKNQSEEELTLIQEKKTKAFKGMKKLLNVTEKYSNICKEKIGGILQIAALERVDNMMSVDQDANKDGLLKTLKFFEGTLRPYQVEGVVWLKTLFEHGINGILADEMGLGKTIEIIALLCHMVEKRVCGPFLIIVPLSTLPNWKREFAKFAPLIPIIIFHGDIEKRQMLNRQITQSFKVNSYMVKPVIITTAAMISKEINSLSRLVWKYVIIDEGHIIKNAQSKISGYVRSLKSLNRILLTGTPLQNNLTELWSLLNFLMPQLFKNVDTFAELLMINDLKDNEVKEEQCNMISVIHKVIKPFMLRRLKSEVLKDLVPKKEVLVYCPLSKLQRTLYMYTINKNITALRGVKEETIDIYAPRSKRKCTVGKVYMDVDDPDDVEMLFTEEELAEEEKILGDKIEGELVRFLYTITMQSPMTMYKKIVDHPYLVYTPVTPDKKNIIVDEELVNESGKMLVLDAMLSKLKMRHHKVLIFSTMVMMLDLIEEYMIMRGHNYRRLDGQMKLDDREICVDEFNNDPEVFCFLISTRAGGLGLNLIGADTVIFYDRDWNPQVDLQAQDRCHRIGQKKPVMVYSLVTRNTIDDRVVTCGTMKRKLEKIVIKKGKFKSMSDKDEDINLLELKNMLENEQTAQICSNGFIFSDDELDRLLDRADLYKQMEAMLEQNKENLPL